MDNFEFDVSVTGKDNLRRALEICFSINSSTGKARWWSIRSMDVGAKDAPPVPTLILYWKEPEPHVRGEYPCNQFLVETAPEYVAEMIWQWVEAQELPPGMYLDAQAGHAARVFVEDWGMVAGSHIAICGVQLATALYGK